MPENIGDKVRILLLSTVLSIPLGLLFCDIYVSLSAGGGVDALVEIDLLAFWYVTPLYIGRISPLFIHCVIIVAVTVFVVMVGLAALLFKKQHHGTARWGRFAEMARLKYLLPYEKVSGPIFGKTTGPRGLGKYLSNGPQPHSLVVAPTRAGKGVGVVIPTLLTFNGSVLALDVKGELFELTSRARKRNGDNIFKFAPMDKEGRTHCYNPVLDIVATSPERRFSEARRLANNLITSKGKGAEGFIDGARDLFVAGVLACIERGEPTIGAVYDLFSQPGEKYKLFAQLAEGSKIPEVQRIFDNMAGNDTKIITSYTSVLGDGGLNLWADPLIKNATSRSDFNIYNLRRDPTTIYLTVSPNDLEVIAPLVRLFFQQLVSILQQEMPGKDEIFEVLFLLDEFKHLGQLEAIETAVTTIAGYGGRFMFIIQSLSALTGAYEQAGKENFLSNTGVQVFMATADDETPEYISKSIGDYTFTAKSKSYDSKQWWNAQVQASEQGEKLLRPEQVRLINDNMQIVLVKGQPPLHMHKVKYYADRKLKKIFEAQAGPLPMPDPVTFDPAPTEAAKTPHALANAEELDDEGIPQDMTGGISTAEDLSATTESRENADERDASADSGAPYSDDTQWTGTIGSSANGDAEDVGTIASNWIWAQENKKEENEEANEKDRHSDISGMAHQRALLDRIIALQRRSSYASADLEE
ncbi:type IV secretion system protein VirD4 [Ensifer sp. Root31]|uniref:type IV secretion system ATPase VirD4 n=1 Tax=Ensifer sp. Root31 TaxID=1736512 RepID=UPI00070AEBC3|nr:type IV secretion system ATPase VirD4 [Ensifer sp. Root31]KQU85450.1 type IV secretion system protein VirD4 [Ensifer sp. Root31]